jgi:hypothetical protein
MSTPRDPEDDAQLADALRRALAKSAAQVHPLGDGLSKIRARTAARRRQRWLVPVAAAGTAVAVVGGIVWASGALEPDEAPFASPGPTISSPDPTGSTGATTGVTVTPTPEPTATVPVYYLGAQPRESGLPLYKVFREFHRVPAADPGDRADRVRVAVTDMFKTAPLDDDYFSPWPETAAVLDVVVDETAAEVTIDLTGLEWTDVPLPDPDERLVQEIGGALVQQLVYTVTGAASRITADDEFSATGVRLLVDGAPIDELLGVDTSEPLSRDPSGYQAIIWITEPEFGETVNDPITVRLVANLFEGSGSWELLRDGVVIDEGPTSMGEGGVWAEYEFMIDGVEPGTYELVVFDAGGLGIPELAPYDSKTFTVN